MILASIEGTIGAAVLVLLMLAIRWVGSRFSEKRPDAQGGKQSVPKSAAALGARKGDSEEERMRRFLEALGIPADGVEESRRQTPPPLRPAQRREPSVKPVPPIVVTSSPPRRVPPVTHRPAPAPAAPKVEPPSQLQPPTLEVQLPALQTPEAPEFQTATSQISAIPGESAHAHAATGQSEPSSRELWREALRSPEGLRSAFILREILGTPRGLQSNGITPSFPIL